MTTLDSLIDTGRPDGKEGTFCRRDVPNPVAIPPWGGSCTREAGVDQMVSCASEFMGADLVCYIFASSVYVEDTKAIVFPRKKSIWSVVNLFIPFVRLSYESELIPLIHRWGRSTEKCTGPPRVPNSTTNLSLGISSNASIQLPSRRLLPYFIPLHRIAGLDPDVIFEAEFSRLAAWITEDDARLRQSKKTAKMVEPCIITCSSCDMIESMRLRESCGL